MILGSQTQTLYRPSLAPLFKLVEAIILFDKFKALAYSSAEMMMGLDFFLKQNFRVCHVLKGVTK